MAKMDKLSRDAKDAISMGMSYGKYMAQKQPEIIIPTEPKVEMRECLRCGTLFPPPTRGSKAKKFCSDGCRDKFNNERYYESKKEQKPETHKICPICGKDFIPMTPWTKYCCDFCAGVGKVERIKQCQQRRKERMLNGNNQVL